MRKLNHVIHYINRLKDNTIWSYQQMEEKVDKIQYPDILYIFKNSQPIGNKRKLHQIIFLKNL